MRNNKGVIYCYTNKLNGKQYIGQTINEGRRKSEHLNLAMSGKSNTHFHKAIRKYGIDNFQYEVLEVCDKELLDEREIAFISEFDTFKNGYNQTSGGMTNDHWIGRKHTDSTKEKQRKASKTSKRVKMLDLDGNVIDTFDSMCIAAKRVDGKQAGISIVCRGKRPSYKGFKWSYITV